MKVALYPVYSCILCWEVSVYCISFREHSGCGGLMPSIPSSDSTWLNHAGNSRICAKCWSWRRFAPACKPGAEGCLTWFWMKKMMEWCHCSSQVFVTETLPLVPFHGQSVAISNAAFWFLKCFWSLNQRLLSHSSSFCIVFHAEHIWHSI